MHDFDYRAPGSLDEALTLLAEASPEARVLAGGTDLLAQMKEGRRRPRLLIDVKGIPELMGVTKDGNGALHLGAAASLASVLALPALTTDFPILAEACSLIGAVQIQNRASLGGNLCNAAPSADSAPALICLGARCIVASRNGRREIPVASFFVGPGQTVLTPDELLVEIVVPPAPSHSGGSYLRHTPRAEMDIAVAGVGSFVILAPGDGVCQEARIVLGAVGPTPIRAREAEASLAGRALNEATIEEAAQQAAQAARPISDVRGSAEYRRHLVAVLTRRTLRQAAARAALS